MPVHEPCILLNLIMTIKECIFIILYKEKIDKEVYKTLINIFTQCMNVIKPWVFSTLSRPGAKCWHFARKTFNKKKMQKPVTHILPIPQKNLTTT